MNIYMGYSRAAGPEYGAILIFAATAKEARRIGWRYAPWIAGYPWWVAGEEYLDFATRRMRDSEWLYEEADQKKLAEGVPHVIDDMRYCRECGSWGHTPINDDGLCQYCMEGVPKEEWLIGV